MVQVWLHDIKGRGKMEPLAKLAVSKSKNERDAVVHNYAHEHQLSHTVRTLNTIRNKECRCIDFEQRKFLQSLSLTPEDLEEASALAPSKAAPNGTSVVHLGLSSDDSVAQLYHTVVTDDSKELLGVTDKDLSRSLSDMDIRRSDKPRSYRGRSKTFTSGEAEVSSNDSAEPADPYSISCSMKVSESRGSFEASTGKYGLSAWMGKKCPPQNPVRKFIY